MPAPADDDTLVRVWVGLGANLGDPVATLHEAFEALAEMPHTRLVARSAAYRSAPVDAAGPDFINAVAELATRLAPRTLLRELQAIEQRHGRERPYRNAPRTLDLDLLLYGDEVIATPTLTVPHPRLHQRAFVLAPLAEIAPRLAIPGHGPVSGLLAQVRDQAIERLGAGAPARNATSASAEAATHSAADSHSPIRAP